jgi:peptide/nickel transport system permease protein
VTDNAIVFITNPFTVIPGFVPLILISFSIGQNDGAFTIAVVIGLTSRVWTARAVRAQVISPRNRDHVNCQNIGAFDCLYPPHRYFPTLRPTLPWR